MIFGRAMSRSAARKAKTSAEVIAEMRSLGRRSFGPAVPIFPASVSQPQAEQPTEPSGNRGSNMREISRPYAPGTGTENWTMKWLMNAFWS